MQNHDLSQFEIYLFVHRNIVDLYKNINCKVVNINELNTKIHQKWLADLNLNRANYYVENEQLKTTLQNQRLIIAKLEKDVQNKMMTIDYLTQQLHKKCNENVVTDLLDLDV